MNEKTSSDSTNNFSQYFAIFSLLMLFYGISSLGGISGAVSYFRSAATMENDIGSVSTDDNIISYCKTSGRPEYIWSACIKHGIEGRDIFMSVYQEENGGINTISLFDCFHLGKPDRGMQGYNWALVGDCAAQIP